MKTTGISKIAIWEKINGIEQDRTRLNGKGIGFENIVDYRSLMANENQWLPFMIVHNRSYFINKIKLFYIISTIKSRELSLKLVFVNNCSWILCVCSLVFGQDLLIFPHYKWDLMRLSKIYH